MNTPQSRANLTAAFLKLVCLSLLFIIGKNKHKTHKIKLIYHIIFRCE